VAVYSRPRRGERARRWLPSPNADGAPLTFLVKRRRPGWLHVYLPVRPNGSTGWVRAPAVSLAVDDYGVRVDLRRHRITVRQDRKLVDDEPIGVGRAVTPTPSGRYYIVELLQPPDPNGLYGPYAFGLSAYSPVLTGFAGGTGEIGIHGTNFPQGLGTDVSHGCIRMSNAGITRLARRLPLGTPVLIVR
jgi:lipoprotein-anchoring transpeptidase ErfK/SrfK